MLSCTKCWGRLGWAGIKTRLATARESFAGVTGIFTAEFVEVDAWDVVGKDTLELCSRNFLSSYNR
jgi:hypothetical protein